MGQVKYIPEVGKQYGQWTVISRELKRHSEKNSRTAFFNVRCSCGREGWRSAHNLEKGTTKGCKSCCKSPNNINSFILSYYNRVKRRAEKSNFQMDITPQELEKLFIIQNKKCALSGVEIEFRPTYLKNEQTASLDRKDNTLGYIKNNVQWVHKQVNFMKGIMNQEEFISFCKLIASR